MNTWRRQSLLALLLASLVFPLAAEEVSGGDPDGRIVLTRWAGVGAITAWGLLTWDYGKRPLHINAEGWFGADTKEGGADKLGHLYTSYLMTRSFTGLYQYWGAERKLAARSALTSSLLLTGFMELGDGFSPYGISHEDMIMNVAGGLIGYELATHEDWQRRIDLRVEYEPSGASDPLTDYEHARYLVAVKLNGFSALEHTPLKWLELQAGYYARGFGDPLQPDHRISYVGVSLNFSALLEHAGWNRTATVLQYYQLPGTSLRVEHEY